MRFSACALQARADALEGNLFKMCSGGVSHDTELSIAGITPAGSDDENRDKRKVKVQMCKI